MIKNINTQSIATKEQVMANYFSLILTLIIPLSEKKYQNTKHANKSWPCSASPQLCNSRLSWWRGKGTAQTGWSHQRSGSSCDYNFYRVYIYSI
jgi:hypothetical protein